MMTAEKLAEVQGRYEQDRRRAKDRRDAAVRQAFEEGMTAPAIARATGLTRGRIWQILRPNDS